MPEKTWHVQGLLDGSGQGHTDEPKYPVSPSRMRTTFSCEMFWQSLLLLFFGVCVGVTPGDAQDFPIDILSPRKSPLAPCQLHKEATRDLISVNCLLVVSYKMPCE